MQRRSFLALSSAALGFAQDRTRRQQIVDCGCSFAPQPPQQATSMAAFEPVQSGIKNHRYESVLAVSLNPATRTGPMTYFARSRPIRALWAGAKGRSKAKPGRPWPASRTLRDFVIGADPMQVEHIWQSMYVHSFYRAGPVMGSAISAIDQALWDIRGKALGVPVYRLLGGPLDPRGVRGLLSRRRSAHIGRSGATA